MFFVGLVREHIVVTAHEAEGVRTHIVIVLILDTAGGQDGFWQSQLIVRVGIEETVAIANRGIVVLLIYTGTIGIGLIGLVHDVMLTLGMRYARGNQSVQAHRLDGLILQLTAEHHLCHLNVVVVVLQFVEDVKPGIEASVIDVGVKATACVQSIAEGIDVEVALHLACYHVGSPVQ